MMARQRLGCGAIPIPGWSRQRGLEKGSYTRREIATLTRRRRSIWHRWRCPMTWPSTPGRSPLRP